MFNLSAIVGSAILYGDFRRASFHQIVTFLYGCAATFAGVFIIAWSPPPAAPGEDGEQTELTGEEGDSVDLEAGNAAGQSVVPRDVRMGSLGRRDRPTLVIPESMAVDGGAHGTPVLRNRQSMIDLIGLSPAQVSRRVVSPFLVALIDFNFLAASALSAHTPRRHPPDLIPKLNQYGRRPRRLPPTQSG